MVLIFDFARRPIIIITAGCGNVSMTDMKNYGTSSKPVFRGDLKDRESMVRAEPEFVTNTLVWAVERSPQKEELVV